MRQTKNIQGKKQTSSSKRLLLAALLICGVVGTWAQNNYIFYNTTYGYLINNNGNPGVSTTFSKSAIWVASSALGNTSRYIYSYTDNTKYMTRSGTSLGFSNTTSQYWRTTNNYLRYRLTNSNNYYLKYTNSAFELNSTADNGNLFTAAPITINTNSTTSNPTLSITAASGLTGGGIQLTGSVSGTYSPSYSYATVRNYNNATTQTYYWTATTEATTANPSINNWSDATRTWEVTTGAAYASVNSDGLVTITGNPTGNIVVRMTVSKGGYTGNTSITITRNDATESTDYTYSPISITPTSATLDLGGTQVYAVSNTVTESTNVTPAHVTLSVGGNTYYWYNNALNASTPAPSSTTTTLNLSNVSWADGEGGGYYTLSTYYSDNSNQVTLTRNSLKSNTNLSYTITATANYGGKSQGLTATATVNIPATYVDLDGISCSDIAVTYGQSGTLEPSTWINGTGAKYEKITYTVADPSVASVDENGVVTALKAGTTTVTLQAKKIDGTNGVSCTANITVTPAQLPAPTISINTSTGVATITDNSGISGAVIRYTTDGTDPTATTATTVASGGTVTLTRGQTIKAIVTMDNGNYSASTATTDIFIVTGAFDDIVYLNDFEDHTWTYYSDKPDADYPNTLRSPDPRNVKITYKGGSVNNASAVAVSATESQNTFVYYKTIEKKAWGESEGRWLTGDYPYRTIPNPFLKRPRTTGTTGTNGFWGFAGWKVVSGGEYINEYNNNDIIPADQLIHFVNLPAGNDGNGAIELEAQWAAATVVTVNGNVSANPNTAFADGSSCETNFVVVSGNDRTVTGLTRNMTIMGCYPDGSGATGARLGTVTGSANDLVIENINLGTGGNDFTANTGWLVVGRGCTGNVRRVIGNTGQIRIRIESGVYNFIYPMHNNGQQNSSSNNFGRIIFGNDYDRATNDGLTSNDQYVDNSSRRKLRVINYVSLNSGNAAGKANNTDRTEYMDITIKSGYYGFSADYSLYSTTNANNADGFGVNIGGNTDNADSYTAPDIDGVERTYSNLNAGVNNTTYLWQRLTSFYCGRTRGGVSGGINRVLVEGGELNSINGGGYGNTGANFDVCYHFRMKGGWVKGAIYGTASASTTQATTKQVITGGEINGWIAGACNGTDVNNAPGENQGNTYIYLGGNAECRSHKNDGVYNNAWGLVGGVEGGNIFASGRGTPATAAQPNRNYCGSSYKTYVVVADQSKLEQNVCGGGYIGVAQNSYIYVTGGEIGEAVYGGSMTPTSTSNTWITQTTDIRQYGGTVKGGIYGGHYMGTDNAGKIHQTTSLKIVNGQVGTDIDHKANIHGGGFGAGTSVGGNVDVTIGDETATTSLIIYGDIYGGSALGTVNTNTSNTTTVNLYKGNIYGNAYGGGLGDESTAAIVNGNVVVNLNGAAFGKATIKDDQGNDIVSKGRVFGCNNVNGTPKGTVTVHVYKTAGLNGAAKPARNTNVYEVQAVYGGGNLAAYQPTASNTATKVIIDGCGLSSIAYVYGGGNAAPVPATDVTVNGSYEIDYVFGGGNGKDRIQSGGTWEENPGADVGKVNGVSYGTTDPIGTTTTTIYGGVIHHVFGGSNTKGDVTKEAHVILGDQNLQTCEFKVDEVYGAGNEAYMSGNANITLNCIEGLTEIYGGSRMADIGSSSERKDVNLTIHGGRYTNVFGGNNLSGRIYGKINVTIQEDGCLPIEIDHLYLGGNKALYSVFGYNNDAGKTPKTSGTSYGDPELYIISATRIGEVYGGGYGEDAIMYGNPHININMEPGEVNGEYEYISSNTEHPDAVSPTEYANYDKTKNTTDTFPLKLSLGNIGTVFGGGNAAKVVGDTHIQIGTGLAADGTTALKQTDDDSQTRHDAQISGNVYGGGNQAEVTGKTNVVIGHE